MHHYGGAQHIMRTGHKTVRHDAKQQGGIIIQYST